ncbi:hypothetical protein AKJ16_DCAP08644 [Drosera capensis]
MPLTINPHPLTPPPLLSLSPSPNPPRLIIPAGPIPTLMARSLSKTLARLVLPSIPPPRLLAVRSRSDRAANFEPVITEDEDLIGDDAEAIAVRKVEDAIHRVIVKRSQPDWIVFVPGASYWVPPKGLARGLAEVIGGLVASRTKGNGSVGGGGDNNSNKRDVEGLKVVSNRGWPSSDYFFKGVHPSSLDVGPSPKKTSKSEDEEAGADAKRDGYL